MNLATVVVTLLIGLAALAILPALGGVTSRLLSRRPEPAVRPSLFLPYRCPRCGRRDFEPRGDVAGSQPPSRFTRCRNCGSWFKVWYPGQWQEVTGAEVEDPTPGPQPRQRRLTLRHVMIAIALMAVSFSVSARMARLARAAGRPFDPSDRLLWTSVTMLAFWLAYACREGAPSPTSPSGPHSSIIWINLIIYFILLVAFIIFFIIIHLM